jgi:hypothetical protein
MLRRLSIPVVVGLVSVALAVCRAGAEDGAPAEGKGKIVAARFLKNVDNFRRNVVFFRKDAGLPCLRLPAPGERTLGFVFATNAIRLLEGQPYCEHVEMISDGDLVFAGSRTIFRVNKKGRADKLASLAELTLTGANAPPKDLHFENLLGTSATAAVLYIGLSNETMESGVPIQPSDYAHYVGKLDIPARKLLLLPCGDSARDVVIDADAGRYYQVRAVCVAPAALNDNGAVKVDVGSIKCRDFNGKMLGQWPLPLGFSSIAPAPEKRAILLIPEPSPDDATRFSLLDLNSGAIAELPIRGHEAAWGANQTLYYIDEKFTNEGVVDSSLFRFRIGDKQPTRLFLFSCKHVKMKDTLFGMAPRLSADRTWLAWQLPAEQFQERETILLDIANGEYRIMEGHWEGVQWDAVRAASGR